MKPGAGYALMILMLTMAAGCGRTGEQRVEHSPSAKTEAVSAETTETGSENSDEKSDKAEAYVSSPLRTIRYSNLADENSRKLAADLLRGAGVSEERITLLFQHVYQFNSSVDPSALAEGWEEIPATEKRYDPYDLQDQWTAKQGEFPGYNCRLTVMGIFGDNVDAPEMTGKEDTALYLDHETLHMDPSALMEKDKAVFDAVFATVPTKISRDISEQVQTLQNVWKERGVRFRGNPRISDISVVFFDQFGDDDSRLFIGHTGLLLSAEDGKLYFLEKLAFQEPYRLVELKDRRSLSDYLMESYDIEWNQPGSTPFLMENDQLMEGWRENPAKKRG